MSTRKRKKDADEQEGDDSSSGDDSSVNRHVSGEQSGSNQAAGGAYVGSHVASVCNEINAKAERAMSPFERLMLKKRRETNRLSARRCRKRRREEIKQLETQLRILQTETEQLDAEKARLQAVLQQEIAISSSRNNLGQGMNLQTHLPQADPMMLQWWMQQRRRMGFFPGNLAPVDSSMASLPPVMPPSSRFDIASLGRLAGAQNAVTHQSFASAARPPPSLSPLDMLKLLPTIQARPDTLSGTPTVQTPWLMPQTLATSNQMDMGASSLAAALRSNQLDVGQEAEKSRSVESLLNSTNWNEYISRNRTTTDESDQQAASEEKR